MTSEQRNYYRENNFIDERKPFIIDQCAFQVPTALLNEDYLKEYETGERITARKVGKRYYIHLHDIVFNYSQEIIQSVFDEINDNYHNHNFPIFNRVVTYEDILEHFKLRVIEFAFDFYTDFCPIYTNYSTGSMKPILFEDDTYTLYSSDYKVYYVNGKKNKVVDSLICLYLRSSKLQKNETGKSDNIDWANKIGHDKTIYRLEYRLKDKYISKLKTSDLLKTPMGLSRTVKPILIDYSKSILQPHSMWPVNAEFVKFLQPYLYDILKESSQKSLKPFKDFDLKILKKHLRAYIY